MKPQHHAKEQEPAPAPRRYRQAFEELDAILGANTRLSNDEKIEKMGAIMFGDLWEGIEDDEGNFPTDRLLKY